MAKKFLFLFIYIIVVFINESFCDNIRLKMEDLKVVPDVIDAPPKEKLYVEFADQKVVKLGNELTPTQVKDAPSVKWNGDSNSFYTLAMVDPDAPSRVEPKFREVLHWLVVNIPGTDVKNGVHIAEYLGSGPPKGTGLHRYIFLVYKQQSKLEFDEPHTAYNSRAHRFNFSIRKFAEKYKMNQPIAGNFYQAQWDEYVDVRNKGIKN